MANLQPDVNADVYDDLALFEQFAGDTQKAIEDAEKNDFEREPITYPVITGKTTTWKFRFHPLIKMDEETGKPKLILTRSIWSHSGFEKTRRLPCQGRDCPICAETKKLKEIKHPDAWKYTSKNEAIAMVYINETNAAKDYKYMRVGEYSFFSLRSKAVKSLNDFMGNLSAEEMKSVLNPRIKAPRLMFTVSSGSEGSSSWSFDLKQMELPPVPEEFPDINDVYVKEDQPATGDEMKTVKITVNKLLAAATGTLVQPDDNPPPPPTTASGSKAAAKSKVASILKAAPPPSMVEEEDSSCPGTEEGLSYGNHPATMGGEVSVSCLSCPKEGKCEEVTKKQHSIS